MSNLQAYVVTFLCLVCVTQTRIILFEKPCCLCVEIHHCSNGTITVTGMKTFTSAYENSTSSIYNFINVDVCSGLSEACCQVPQADATCQKKSSSLVVPRTRIGSADSFPSLPSFSKSSTPPPPISSPVPPFNLSFPQLSSTTSPKGNSTSSNGREDRSKSKGGPRATVPTRFGEHPWQALILQKVDIGSKTFNMFLSSGSLIHDRVLLTTGRAVYKQNKDNLFVRLGEWDINSEDEPHPHQDVEIKEILIHPKFVESPLIYDFALVFLKENVLLKPNVQVIQLASKRRSVLPSQCVILEWEKTEPKLVSYNTSVLWKGACQSRIRRAKLGKAFKLKLHPSFLCAEGARSNELSEIDKGSPLVCRRRGDASNFIQVGIASWKMESRKESPLGVYADVIKAYKWIWNNVNNRNQQSPIFFPISTRGAAKRADFKVNTRISATPQKGTRTPRRKFKLINIRKKAAKAQRKLPSIGRKPTQQTNKSRMQKKKKIIRKG